MNLVMEDDLEDVDFSSKRAKQDNYDSFDNDPDFPGQFQTETAVGPLKRKTKNSSLPKPKRPTSNKEPLPGVLGNTGTVAFIFREQGIFSNYFQGTGELLTRLLGSREHQFTFNNGQ